MIRARESLLECQSKTFSISQSVVLREGKRFLGQVTSFRLYGAARLDISIGLVKECQGFKTIVLQKGNKRFFKSENVTRQSFSKSVTFSFRAKSHLKKLSCRLH